METVHKVASVDKSTYDRDEMCINCSAQHGLNGPKYLGKYAYEVDFGLPKYPYALIVAICDGCQSKIAARSDELGSFNESTFFHHEVPKNTSNESLCDGKCNCASTIEYLAKNEWDRCWSPHCRICVANSQ